MPKTVPSPSLGRIVLFRALPTQHRTATEPFPALIVGVEILPDIQGVHSRAILPARAYRVNLAVLSPEPTRAQVLFRVSGAAYGEDKPGCWWWPERVSEEMVVED
jgi:hypothetical protein